MIRFPLIPRSQPAAPVYATIALSAHRSAQGPDLRSYRDGRVVIDTGRGHLTGRPLASEAPELPVWTPLLFVGMV